MQQVQQKLILHIIRGLPGSGKSTEALKAALGKEENIFELDKYPGIYDERGYYVLAKKEDSIRWMEQNFREALLLKRSPLVISNTSMRQEYYQKFIDLARLQGYTIIIKTQEAIIFPDGGSPQNVHKVPYGIIQRMRMSYQQYIPMIRDYWEKPMPVELPENPVNLRVLDRDKTIVYNPDGGVPNGNDMEPIEAMVEIVKKWKEQGDYIAIASNQGGCDPKQYNGREPKTEEELLAEARFIQDVFKPDLQLYCPLYDGSVVWDYNNLLDHFTKTNLSQSPFSQSFRKPDAGMLEYIMKTFYNQFDLVELIGNSREDELAAQAAGIPFRHVHNVLYP